MNAEITHKHGIGLSGRVYFRMIKKDAPVTEEEAKVAQYRLGYPDGGYDFLNFAVGRDGDLFVAHWQCTMSAD